jgi:hypothetical protein
MHIYICVYTYIYTYIYMYTYVYIYTQFNTEKRFYRPASARTPNAPRNRGLRGVSRPQRQPLRVFGLVNDFLEIRSRVKSLRSTYTGLYPKTFGRAWRGLWVKGGREGERERERARERGRRKEHKQLLRERGGGVFRLAEVGGELFSLFVGVIRPVKMYLHVYIYIRVYIHINIYIYVYIYKRMCIYTHSLYIYTRDRNFTGPPRLEQRKKLLGKVIVCFFPS